MLLSITLLTALASTLSTALPAPAPAASPVGCYPGAYVIVARASYEPVGEGRLAAVSQNILAQYPGSASVAVDYPATLKDYGSSLAQGAWDMTSKIVTYVNACGNSSKVVLLGYSQGAQVVAVTLAGNAATENSPGSQGLSTFYGKQSMCISSKSFHGSDIGLRSTVADNTSPRSTVKAGVLLGDVSFTANQTFDAGNATTSGVSLLLVSLASEVPG